MGISLGDMRISVGQDNIDDLIEDLEHSLELIKKSRVALVVTRRIMSYPSS